MGKFTLTAFADESSRELEEQLEVLKHNRIGYIELRGVNGKNITEHTLEEARLVKQALDRAGIKVSSIGSPIGKIDFADPFEKTTDLLRHTLALMKVLDADRYIRVFSYYPPKGQSVRDIRGPVIERMRALAGIAAGDGVTLVHEHEEGIYGETIENYYDLITSVDHPNFKGLFDTANFVYAGQLNMPDAFEKVKGLVRYIHIKDLKDGKYVVPGTGTGQVKEFLRAMLDYGYEGYVSLEPHLTAFEGLQHLMRSSDFMPENSGDGIEKFNLAFGGLKKILDELGAEAGQPVY